MFFLNIFGNNLPVIPNCYILLAIILIISTIRPDRQTKRLLLIRTGNAIAYFPTT